MGVHLEVQQPGLLPLPRIGHEKFESLSSKGVAGFKRRYGTRCPPDGVPLWTWNRPRRDRNQVPGEAASERWRRTRETPFGKVQRRSGR